MAARKTGLAETAAKADLAAVAKHHPGIAKSCLAATLLELARQMDSERNSATAKSMCAKALFEGFDRLRAAAPAKTAKTPLDEIRARRDTKIRAAGASG